MELGEEVSNSKPRNPLKEDKDIIQNIGISNTGLLDSHKILSNTKRQFDDVEQYVALHQKLRERKKAQKAAKNAGKDASKKSGKNKKSE